VLKIGKFSALDFYDVSTRFFCNRLYIGTKLLKDYDLIKICYWGHEFELLKKTLTAQ
jgi:hypothetical protein